jgi:spermidine synthase
VLPGECSKTLVDEIKFEGRITGVEIDPEIIQLANDLLSEIQQLKRNRNDDAFEFVLDQRDMI